MLYVRRDFVYYRYIAKKNMIDVVVIWVMHYSNSSSSIWYLFLLKYALIIHYLKIQ
jgi:hypothetical protein